jgi:folate-dependent phosphoribosylglycinamide formyltransferase PurN
VHLVDAEYDTGAVVRQERVPIVPGDTLESFWGAEYGESEKASI